MKNQHILNVLLLLSVANVQASTLQDPTKPSNYAQSNNSDSQQNPSSEMLKLTAIMISKQHKQAIINGESFEEGQSVENYKVLSIAPTQVVLHGSDGRQTLVINNNDIKKDIHNGF
jgi:MSHA biogenesis protein MshK